MAEAGRLATCPDWLAGWLHPAVSGLVVGSTGWRVRRGGEDSGQGGSRQLLASSLAGPAASCTYGYHGAATMLARMLWNWSVCKTSTGLFGLAPCGETAPAASRVRLLRPSRWRVEIWVARARDGGLRSTPTPPPRRRLLLHYVAIASPHAMPAVYRAAPWRVVHAARPCPASICLHHFLLPHPLPAPTNTWLGAH